ncbi:MAG: DUF2306 domain-containing protein [Pseudomonadota bacterium]
MFETEAVYAAGLAIQAHLASVAVALATGAVLLAVRRGGPTHKTAGRVWAGAMMAAAATGLFIPSTLWDWWFGPIHIFSLIVLYNVPRAILAIRRGDVAGHRAGMLGMAFGGLGVAGGLALLPGRTLHAVVFGA